MSFEKLKDTFKKTSFCITLLLICINFVLAQGNEHIYSTWDKIEVDTCATAWLIKNFVDKNAVFKFYPKGEIITEGIAFDTPDAEFRRTADFCAYETVLNKYKIDNYAPKEIGRIIHEIEINYWNQDSKAKTLEFNQKVLSQIEASATPEEGFKKTFLIFNELHKDLLKSNKE